MLEVFGFERRSSAGAAFFDPLKELCYMFIISLLQICNVNPKNKTPPPNTRKGVLGWSIVPSVNRDQLHN